MIVNTFTGWLVQYDGLCSRRIPILFCDFEMKKICDRGDKDDYDPINTWKKIADGKISNDWSGKVQSND